jgi:hypothetical protein
VVIAIIVSCSSSLATIAIYLDNPLAGIYCATVFVIIVFLALWFSPAKSTTMDPDQEPVDYNASQCADSIASISHATSGASRASSRNSSQQLPPALDIILCISPAAGSATFGYILVAENKRHQEGAIAIYYDSAGQEVTVLPCPNFANFLIEHSIQEHNVSLIIDLPCYIIPAGTRILQANHYSASPNQDWLPVSLDLSSLYALSQRSSHRLSLSLQSLLLHHNAHGLGWEIHSKIARNSAINLIPDLLNSRIFIKILFFLL